MVWPTRGSRTAKEQNRRGHTSTVDSKERQQKGNLYSDNIVLNIFATSSVQSGWSHNLIFIANGTIHDKLIIDQLPHTTLFLLICHGSHADTQRSPTSKYCNACTRLAGTRCKSIKMTFTIITFASGNRNVA